MISIEKSNQESLLDRMMNTHPVLVGVEKAGDVIPGMRPNLFLHAGPPITWTQMCGPMKGAVMGALIFEGMAKDAQDAAALAQTAEIEFSPCHHHGAIGPMAGVISPSMQVYIVENRTYGNKAYSGMNEGRGKVLRMGAYSDEVVARLKWLNSVFGPILNAAIQTLGGLDLRTLVAKALHMGDEGHNRLDASSLLYATILAPFIARAAPDAATAFEVMKFMGENPICALNPLMAACKCMADAGHGIEGSTIVTAMARNGVEFGIRVSGMGDRWFTGPASIVDGLYLPGFSEKDANPDIGDSTITETVGIGGFAMAAAPAIVKSGGWYSQGCNPHHTGYV